MKNKKRNLIVFGFLVITIIYIFSSFITRSLESTFNVLPKKDEDIVVNEERIYKIGDYIVDNSVYFSGFINDSISIGVMNVSSRGDDTTQLYYPLKKNQIIETDVINAPFSFTEKFKVVDFNAETGRLELKRVK
ncbi:hypothetical protein [Bacillus sp. B1-b2]|nr:hypothetical protein [Bacillus sp. B1-b2]